MKNSDLVVLVDSAGNIIGEMEKMEAHQKGLLHSAISVFIFNTEGEWLLQQRADNKYHSSSLWTNTCCSHPRINEESLATAKRRLMEEMGMTANLQFLYQHEYRVELDNNLTENELDSIFIGKTDELPKINSDEAQNYKYMSTENLTLDLNNNPEKYTEWFKLFFPIIVKKMSL